MKKYYFVGIGGSGMNPLAQILCQRGNWIGGSDRNFDRGTGSELFAKLQKQGIKLFPQDGSGITGDLDAMVISTAIETQNIELEKARQLSLPIIHRADLLAEIFNAGYGIAIGGTSGKTTVTGMVASILEKAGMDPTVINGGVIKHYATDTAIGNAKNGSSDYVIIETDESDGSIVKFYPNISVINNISKDHKEMHELQSLFQTFADHTKNIALLNGDSAELKTISTKNSMTYGLGENSVVQAVAVRCTATGSTFQVRDMQFTLSVPGLHNVYNATAAIAVGIVLGLPLSTIRDGISKFTGIQRRLEIVSTKNNITVIDDFAHNPDKIQAALETLKQMGERLIIIFQPHGYGPTRFLLSELAAAFSASLNPSDFLFLLPIYDAGGTADRSISSADLAKKIHCPQVVCGEDRLQVITELKRLAQAGDVIVVMGARDDTLQTFARHIAESIF
jgi:UDP-N-acetylmuramate--alanine ligase